jgi:hypothetical protein
MGKQDSGQKKNKRMSEEEKEKRLCLSPCAN